MAAVVMWCSVAFLGWLAIGSTLFLLALRWAARTAGRPIWVHYRTKHNRGDWRYLLGAILLWPVIIWVWWDEVRKERKAKVRAQERMKEWESVAPPTEEAP
jgi:hypothetical protein